MKYLIIIAAALVAVVSPVNAKLPPRCTGSCHFFRAWALTKLCPNISFNEAGREAVEFFVHSSEAREILRQETIGVKKNVDISYGRDAEIIERPRTAHYCNPDCKLKPYEGTELESSECHFLQWAKPHGAHKN